MTDKLLFKSLWFIAYDIDAINGKHCPSPVTQWYGFITITTMAIIDCLCSLWSLRCVYIKSHSPLSSKGFSMLSSLSEKREERIKVFIELDGNCI